MLFACKIRGWEEPSTYPQQGGAYPISISLYAIYINVLQLSSAARRVHACSFIAMALSTTFPTMPHIVT